jgi:hypothetical protein
MWNDSLVEVCRRHPDLVAVYESRHGRLGLLLRHTLVPLSVERVDWLAETRAVARAVITDLRAARFTGGTLVLQWLPAADVARIMARWVRRWDGDPARRSALTAVVERSLGDQRFLRSRSTEAVVRAVMADDVSLPARRVLDDAGLDALKAWYESMAPHWLAIQPMRRRRLVLQTHVWIAGRALADPIHGPGDALADLRADGPLSRALARFVAGDEAPAWRGWIDLVRLDLERALRRPADDRNQAWARALFLVPYSLPVPRRGQLRAVRGGRAASRPA